MFEVPLPDAKGRLQILSLILQGHHAMDDGLVEYLPTLAETDTVGYSGSDLKELCNYAAREAIRELVKEYSIAAVSSANSRQDEPVGVSDKDNGKKEDKSEDTLSVSSSSSQSSTPAKPDSPFDKAPCPMSKHDMMIAPTKVKPTGQQAAQYAVRELSMISATA